MAATKCSIPGCTLVFQLKNSSSLLEHLYLWHVGSSDAVRCGDCGYGAKWLTSDFRSHLRNAHNGEQINIEDRRHLYFVKASDLLRDNYPDYLPQCLEMIKKWKATAESIGNKNASKTAGGRKPFQVKDELPSDDQNSAGNQRRGGKSVNGTGLPKLECTFCKVVVTRQNMTRHAFSQHSDVPALQCPYCEFKNNCSEMVVSTHVQTKHPDREVHVIDNRTTHAHIVHRCFPGLADLLSESKRRRSTANKTVTASPPRATLAQETARDEATNSRSSIASSQDQRTVPVKLVDCSKCGAQVEDSAAGKAQHFFQTHGQGKAKRYQCPYCSDGDRDIDNTMKIHIQLKHPDRKVVSIDRADKEKYRVMIDELFEQGSAKRVRLSSTPMVDQMLMGNSRRPMRRAAPPDDEILSIYEKRAEPTVRPAMSFGNGRDNSEQFNMHQAMAPMQMFPNVLPFMPQMLSGMLQNQNMTMVMMPMLVPMDYMKQMNPQLMLTNGSEI